MEKNKLVETFTEFATQKNIKKAEIINILNDVFKTLIKKKYESDENFDIVINVDTGDIEIMQYKEIVENNAIDIDDTLQIRLNDAQKIESDFEIGEDVAIELSISDFGRRYVDLAKQLLLEKIKDINNNILYQKYNELVGEMISSEIMHIYNNEIILLDNEDYELSLPKSNQIRNERFRKGDVIKTVVESVNTIKGKANIILSRTSTLFLERLLEEEVPEIYDGLISIKTIAREPGIKSKISVESYDERIDPVGACVGKNGSRIHSIVRELNNENIDIINHTDNLELYITRILNPAKITSINTDIENNSISVFLNPEEISLAIGKYGSNIKLASKLVGMKIDLFRDDVDVNDIDDVEIKEFKDEIDEWMIEELIRIGCDTAKDVLKLDKNDILKRTELEEESIIEIIEIMNNEFQ